MSREIKFRQFFRRKIHYWGYIDNGFIAPLATAEAHDCESGQYTGLKDKSGKEIYEGDILEVDDEFSRTKHEVVWGGDDYPAWTLNPGLECEANDFSEIICGSSYTMEVIDNIYSNPELLEPPLGNNAEPIRKISEDDWRKDDR